MNSRTDQQNAIIERNLRAAHQQISMCPESMERVLGVIANEVERQDAAAKFATVRTRSRRTWRRVALLAAALLIAFMWSTWSPYDQQITKNANPTEAGKNDGFVVQNNPRKKQPDTPLGISPQPSGKQTVKAAEGYLASKLYDDEELEVYLVLPTQNTTFKF